MHERWISACVGGELCRWCVRETVAGVLGKDGGQCRDDLGDLGGLGGGS